MWAAGGSSDGRGKDAGRQRAIERPFCCSSAKKNKMEFDGALEDGPKAGFRELRSIYDCFPMKAGLIRNVIGQ